MNYDIRKLCVYFPNIHSRYYADTNGCIYTSLSPNTRKIMVDGKRVTVTSFINENLPKLNKSDNQMIRFPFSKDYFLLYDGTILQRLKTRIDDIDRITVNLVCIDERKAFIVSRLIAGTFIGNVEGKEIHHLDQDRSNNSVSNLSIMTFEEHRGKGNHTKNHNL